LTCLDTTTGAVVGTGAETLAGDVTFKTAFDDTTGAPLETTGRADAGVTDGTAADGGAADGGAADGGTADGAAPPRTTVPFSTTAGRFAKSNGWMGSLSVSLSSAGELKMMVVLGNMSTGSDGADDAGLVAGSDEGELPPADVVTPAAEGAAVVCGAAAVVVVVVFVVVVVVVVVVLVVLLTTGDPEVAGTSPGIL
jgi:hypothetical protein